MKIENLDSRYIHIEMQMQKQNTQNIKKIITDIQHVCYDLDAHNYYHIHIEENLNRVIRDAREREGWITRAHDIENHDCKFCNEGDGEIVECNMCGINYKKTYEPNCYHCRKMETKFEDEVW